MTIIDSSSKFKLRGKWELGKNILNNNKIPLKEKKKNTRIRAYVQSPEPMGKKLGTVACTYNPRSGEAEADRPLGYISKSQITERLFQEGKDSGCCLRNNTQGCSLVSGYSHKHLHLSINTYPQKRKMPLL